MKNPTQPESIRKRAPQSGLSAASTLGSSRIPRTPDTASARNQTIITGPNARPIRPVPLRCTANNPTMMPTVSGTISGSSSGTRPWMPSTAPNTETAGVIIPSPTSSPAPSTPSSSSTRGGLRLPLPLLSTSENSVRMPPSPSLSARSTKNRYLSDTTSTSAQSTSESRPSTLSGVGGTPWPPGPVFTHSRSA